MKKEEPKPEEGKEVSTLDLTVMMSGKSHSKSTDNILFVID